MASSRKKQPINMEKYSMLAIILVMNMAYVSSTIQPRGEYRFSKNGEFLNKNPCQLYKMTHTYTYKLECQVKCTRLIGCINVHHFPESHVCLVCIDENANITDEWQGLTPYNTPRPQGGELYEKINADECEYGKGCYNGGTCIDGVFSYTCLCPMFFTGSTCEDAFVPSNCAEFGNHIATGVYNVSVQDAQNKTIQVPVYCDMDTDGGGWTVFQRRQDGSVSFAQNWGAFKEGFGDLMGEFWLGNDLLALMTAPPAIYTLRIDMESFDNVKKFAKYANFWISDESDKYRLSIGSYSGTAGDVYYGLSYHNQMQFSTYENDNDMNNINCALFSGGSGGFWYDSCEKSNLNGVYIHSGADDGNAIHWYPWLGDGALKFTEMKLKPLK